MKKAFLTITAMLLVLIVLSGCGEHTVGNASENTSVGPGAINVSNWMLQSPEIHDKLLREICFPSTHDTGTWLLRNQWSPEEEYFDITKIFAEANALVDMLDSELFQIPVIGSLVSIGVEALKTLVFDDIYSAIRGLGTANDKDVAKQLDAGIRGLDLRIYLQSTDAYIHHGLVGPSVNGILDSIRNFLAQKNGEILIVQMSHFIADNHLALTEDYKRFAARVSASLGPYAYLKEFDSGKITNAPFDQSYNKIFTQRPGPGSRVILLFDGPPEDCALDPMFWTPHQLKMHGSYANTESPTTMIADQKKKYDAMPSGATFAISYTLTPQKDNLNKIVLTTVANELKGQLRPHLLFPWVEDLVNNNIDNWLRQQGLAWKGDWYTLEQLSQKVNRNLSNILTAQIQSADTGSNRITIIWADFFDQSDLVQTAIRYSKLPSAVP